MPAVLTGPQQSPQAASPSSSKPGSYVAPGQPGAPGGQPARAYARSLSTLSRPTMQVVSRQTIPGRVGDGLSQTQRTIRAQAAGTRWRSPSGAREAPSSMKVPQRPTFSGAFGGAFSPSAPLSTSGALTAPSMASAAITADGIGGDPDDELSRTWRGAGTFPSVSLGAVETSPAMSTLNLSTREVLVATPAASLNATTAKEMPMAANSLSATRREVAVARTVDPGTPVNEARSMRLSLGKRGHGTPLGASAVPFAPLQRTARRAASPVVPTARASTAPTASEREAAVNGGDSYSSRTSNTQPVTWASAPHASLEAEHVALRKERAQLLQELAQFDAPKRAGSFVAERPTGDEARQTASFTALPMYKWSSAPPAPLRLQTVAGAYTQCGHKKRAPGIPNQDTHSIVPLGPGVMLAAVLDGHGAQGHLVSNFVREIFERYAPRIASLPGAEVPAAFLQVFSLAQDGLENEGLAEMAGTTATLALIDANAGTISVAHVGDSTLAVFVGYTVSFRTKDHVVDDEATRYVEAHGGEVIASTFDGVTARRIYSAAEDSAGLAMSRALGHTELQPLVQNVPEVSIAQFGAGSTVVIASDGIWEKIKPEGVAQIIAGAPPIMTNVQAGNLARTLVKEAARRWPTPPQGDVDDITVVVIRAVPENSGSSVPVFGNASYDEELQEELYWRDAREAGSF